MLHYGAERSALLSRFGQRGNSTRTDAEGSVWRRFIPLPMGLGTLGAFIQIESLIQSRRVVFDVGIAGPLAGLFIALPEG